MTILMKEILADIGVLGTCLPRCLSIPLITSPMETDLLNIQMTVMAMLTEDAEISKIVANNWNLGFEIKAFNVQQQVWDLIDPDDDLEIPKGARIQVNMHSNDPEDECTNPPRGDGLAEQKNISRRDPRRKNREVESYVSSTPFDEEVKPAPVAISKRDPRLKVDSEPDPAAKTVNTEPNINNLSRNDPRRRKLLQKSSSASAGAEPQKDSVTIALSSLGSARRKSSHADSDSDEEGGLQIDETFQDKPSGKSGTRNMITESQLVEVDTIVDKVDDKDDLELWDEIYGSITIDEGVQSKNAIKSGSRVEEKVVAKIDKVKGKPYFEDRKSIEQLERERELLLNLVKERDRMNEIVASVPAPEEIIIDNDSLEEGELSDSAAEDDEIKITKENSETEVEEIQVVASATKIVPGKRNRSFVNDIQDNDPISPKNTSKVSRSRGSTEKKEITPVRNTVNIDLDDFISPASPTGIQLELDNDEIDVIPLEQGPASPTGIQLNLDNDEIDVIPLEREEVVEIVPKDKYKQYWDEFKEQEKKEGSDQELFEVAREKLSKFKKINEQKELRSMRSKNATQAHVPPTELFLKATQNISPFVHPPSTPPPHHQIQSNMSINASSKIGSPGGLFLKAAQGIAPQRPPLGPSPSRGPPLVPPSGPMVTSVLPRFPPPRPAVMRKGIALLDTPDPGPLFPQPVKAVEPPPHPATPTFNSSVPPPLPSNNFSTPPPSTAMKSITPTPNIVKQNSGKGIPSLMKVNVAKPDEEKQQKPNVWKEGWGPLSKTNDSTIRSGSPTRKEFKSGDKNRRQSRDQRSSSRDRKTKDRRSRDKRSQSRSRRSRSRDRRSRSRSRRRSRSKSRRSQSGERRSKSGERSKIGHRRRSSGEKSRKSSTETRTQSAITKMQASDSVMLAFYEGDDCVIEEEVAVEPAAPRRTEQLPEPVRATTAASSHLFMSSLNKPPVAPSPELHNLTSRHPVSALYEYNRRMNYPQPKFYERWGPGGGWAYDIELGPQTYSCPRFHAKKKDAKADGCKYVLQQLGLKYN